MKTLALEFSSPRRSVAVARGGRVLAVAGETEAAAVGPAALIERALAGAGCGRAEVGVVAVGLGPGSYHGVRVAIAVAQGWFLAGRVRLVGVSSADCLAWQTQVGGGRGLLGVAIDAQRGEFYYGEYTLTEETWAPRGELRLASAEEVHARVAAGVALVGPGPWSDSLQGRTLYPAAAAVVALAAGRPTHESPEALEPLYLRAVAYVKAAPVRPVPGVGVRAATE